MHIEPTRVDVWTFSWITCDIKATCLDIWEFMTFRVILNAHSMTRRERICKWSPAGDFNQRIYYILSLASHTTESKAPPQDHRCQALPIPCSRYAKCHERGLLLLGKFGLYVAYRFSQRILEGLGIGIVVLPLGSFPKWVCCLGMLGTRLKGLG